MQGIKLKDFSSISIQRHGKVNSSMGRINKGYGKRSFSENLLTLPINTLQAARERVSIS
jgi:hypothetical protein